MARQINNQQAARQREMEVIHREDRRDRQPATRVAMPIHGSTPIGDQMSGKNTEWNKREEGLRSQFRENQLRQQFRNSKFGQSQMKQHGGGGDQPRDEQGRWTNA